MSSRTRSTCPKHSKYPCTCQRCAGCKKWFSKKTLERYQYGYCGVCSRKQKHYTDSNKQVSMRKIPAQKVRILQKERCEYFDDAPGKSDDYVYGDFIVDDDVVEYEDGFGKEDSDDESDDKPIEAKRQTKPQGQQTQAKSHAAGFGGHTFSSSSALAVDGKSSFGENSRDFGFSSFSALAGKSSFGWNSRTFGSQSSTDDKPGSEKNPFVL